MHMMCHKTGEFHLSDHPLFISIRQIFAHIFASENKVFLTTISGFLGISWKIAKFRELKKVLKLLDSAFLLKHWNLLPYTRVFSSVWQIFVNFVDVRIQVKIQQTSANPRKTSANPRKQVQNKKYLQKQEMCVAPDTPQTSVWYVLIHASVNEWITRCALMLTTKSHKSSDVPHLGRKRHC